MEFGQLKNNSSLGGSFGMSGPEGGKDCYELFVASITIEYTKGGGWDVEPSGIPGFPGAEDEVTDTLSKFHILKKCVCLSKWEKFFIAGPMGNALGTTGGAGFKWYPPPHNPTYKGYAFKDACKDCNNEAPWLNAGDGSCPCNAMKLIQLTYVNSESTHYKTSDDKKIKLDNPGNAKSVIMQIIREERKIRIDCGKTGYIYDWF